MPSKYWIKLYHEILHDRKMATLDDHLWRRTIECFLLAGEQNNEGYLPPLEEISWTLRVDIEQVETDLNELARIGILELTDGCYYVTKFRERQEPMEKAEYMRRLRGDKKKDEWYQNCYQPVTNGHIESDTDKIRIDKDIDNANAITSFHDHLRPTLTTMYANITGQTSIPFQHTEQVFSDLEAIYAAYNDDEDSVVEDGKKMFAKWCSTKGKTGRYYSRTNPAWLGKWLEELAPEPEKTRRVVVPPTAAMCEVGVSLRDKAAPDQPGYMDAITEYRNHMDTCGVCQRAPKTSEVQDIISGLAQRTSVK